MDKFTFKKSCPRCHIAFDCNKDSIEDCQCYSIQLSEVIKTQLQEQYQDCLCKSCLLEIESGFDLKSIGKKN